MDHLPNFTGTAVPYRIPCLSLAPVDEATLQQYHLNRIIDIVRGDQEDALCDIVIQELLWHQAIEQLSSIWSVPYVRSAHIETDADGHRISTAWIGETFAAHIFTTTIRPDVIAKHGKRHQFFEYVCEGLTEAGLCHTWEPDSTLITTLQSFFSQQSQLRKTI